ncbi:MAG: glycerol-3-phosphate 1-O-acyltransferase PlsY [Kiritimatiellae bacterium]|nr:glycerol-3-phosphate 1-O-acyltransferase PlsY [Kiritimatiellia bacterium]
MQEQTYQWVLWLAAAYFSGAVPFGFLIGKMRGIDVRTVGSKNIGATNVYRTVGKKWGLLAFLCDFLKGFVPTLLAAKFAGLGADLPVAVGLACVIGHTLTVFMKFKGGKGVATAFGMMVALIPCLALGALALFVVTVWLSHYISLGSCLAAAALGIAVWFCGCALSMKIVVTLIAVFVIVKHKSNIRRLIDGCENKIY